MCFTHCKKFVSTPQKNNTGVPLTLFSLSLKQTGDSYFNLSPSGIYLFVTYYTPLTEL